MGHRLGTESSLLSHKTKRAKITGDKVNQDSGTVKSGGEEYLLTTDT